MLYYQKLLNCAYEFRNIKKTCQYILKWVDVIESTKKKETRQTEQNAIQNKIPIKSFRIFKFGIKKLTAKGVLFKFIARTFVCDICLNLIICLLIEMLIYDVSYFGQIIVCLVNFKTIIQTFLFEILSTCQTAHLCNPKLLRNKP